MAISLKQHIQYSKDPLLFMQERWLAFDAFESKKYKNIKPFEYQLDFIRNIHNINNNIVVKGRQMHVSSMMELYIAWYIIFNSDKRVFILSHSLEAAKNILEKIKIIIQNYSVDNEKDGIVTKHYFHWEDDFIKNNSTQILLKNRSCVKISGPQPDAGKAEGIDFLYVDEAAYIKNFEMIFAGIGATVMSLKSSKIVIASTPKNNSFFNKLYLNSGLNPIRLHWSAHPEYSKEIKEDRNRESPFLYTSPWFEDLFKNRYRGSVSQVEQELECVVRYQNETNKNKTISLRVDSDFYKKIQDRLHEGETASDYIRSLIEKDLKYYL